MEKKGPELEPMVSGRKCIDCALKDGRSSIHPSAGSACAEIRRFRYFAAIVPGDGRHKGSGITSV